MASGPPPPWARLRRIPTQLYLLGLFGAVLVPLLLFATLLLTRYAADEQRRYEREAVQIAGQVTLIIDAELSGLLALLKGLGASSSLARGDYGQLYEEARRLIEGRDEIIVLRDLDSMQIFNTQRPFGVDLPQALPLDPEEKAALRAGRPFVTNVYRSRTTGASRVGVGVPVASPDGRTLLFALTVPTSRIRDVLVPAVPPGWIVGVGDRDGTYVSRSVRHDDVTGQPGVPEYLAKATGRSGTFTSMNFEGVTLLAGYRRSHMSEWLIAANVRQEVVAAPLRRSLLLVALLGAATLALSICLALFFGRQVTAGAAHLARQAAALGSGEEVRPPSSRLAEFATVGEALAVAGATLKERERERDQAQQALEARTHELEVVLSTVPAAVWFTYDPEVRRVIRNRFAAELMRLPTEDESALAAPSRAAGHITLMKDGRALAPGEMPLQRAMRGERIEDEEYSFAFADGSTRTLLTSATALRGDRGAIVGAVSVSLDITERKRGEDQRRLLINELNHRVKNTLATVQSIAAQTLRGAASLSEAQDALTDRLVALAKAHDILTRESWEGADLREIVTGAIATHATRDRFVVSGPSVWLTPSMSLSLALTLHELATNAVKYGALSNETGTIAIIWRLEAAPGGTRLVLCWEEGGGPTVVPPARRGFGSRLIQKSLSSETGGRAEIEYRPEGLVCTLEVSLDEAVAPPEAA